MRPRCWLRRRAYVFVTPPLGAFSAAVLLALLVWVAMPVTAHEGHDLETTEAAGASRSLPRLIANSESYELVAVLES
jgi:hypothetical protein